MATDYSLQQVSASTLATNKLIRNTYTLLSMTLVFSVITAAISTQFFTSPMVYLGSVIGAMVLAIFVLPKTANSANGLWVVFAITGLFGFSLGPILNMYLGLANGSQIIMTALGGTAVMFFGLSAYALTTKRNFNFMGGFLFVGMLVVLGAAVLNIFMNIPALSLAISGAVIMLMSGFILYDTSRMIHNPEQSNYLLMTVSIYLSIFNIFIHLLQILGVMGGDD